MLVGKFIERERRKAICTIVKGWVSRAGYLFHAVKKKRLFAKANFGKERLCTIEKSELKKRNERRKSKQTRQQTTQVNDNRKSLQNSEQTTRTVSSRAPPEPIGPLSIPQKRKTKTLRRGFSIKSMLKIYKKSQPESMRGSPLKEVFVASQVQQALIVVFVRFHWILSFWCSSAFSIC